MLRAGGGGQRRRGDRIRGTAPSASGRHHHHFVGARTRYATTVHGLHAATSAARYRLGDAAGGVADLEEGLRRDPRNWQGWFNLVTMKYHTGDVPGAIAAARQAKATCPAEIRPQADEILRRLGVHD